MTKRIFYGDDARARVLGGAKALYDAVKVTYGPKGGNVVIDKAYGGPTVTHDGVTVAEAIELEVTDETLGYKVGAELVQQASMRLNKQAGDGTTSVVILTYSIMEEANRLIVAGHNPQVLRKQIEAAADVALTSLKDLVEDISDQPDKVAHVATISAGDEEIGKLVADVMNKVGTDGTVTVEAGQELGMTADIVEGFKIDRGYASPFFITDPSRQETVFEKPSIIVVEHRINGPAELMPVIEKLVKSGQREFVLIADDVDVEALRFLAANKRAGVISPVVVNAPSFGERRKQILSDIALLTSATLIGETSGVSLDKAESGDFGSARRVVVTSEDTTIIEGAGDETAISERLSVLKTQSESANNEFDAEFYDKRRAALSGKVAVIRVGGATETEIDEKKYRVDDAVAATQAALAEGIVAGGGVTLVNLSAKLEERDDNGSQMLMRALRKPMLQLMENAGLNEQVVVHESLRNYDAGYGLDVSNPGDKLVDMKKAGVIDPVRVTREVISSAVSIASTAMTMGALVVDLDDDKE